MSARVIQGDCREVLPTLEAGSVRCCVTSPPYWGLRDYGVEGQIGLEATPEEYVSRLVEVFREVRRVLADDGTLWLNLGDSYSNGGQEQSFRNATNRNMTGTSDAKKWHGKIKREDGLKPKDLVGIPWRVAFALQADGWYLRSDVIWSKPNPMPESVTDRPTKAHEYLFLLSKSQRYYYDAEVIAEPANPATQRSTVAPNATEAVGNMGGNKRTDFEKHRYTVDVRNRRSVWTVTTEPFPGAHFAVMPQALVEPCILAGSAVGDTVLDPFAGSGTVGVVAARHGRGFDGIELSGDYAGMSKRRIHGPLFAQEAP